MNRHAYSELLLILVLFFAALLPACSQQPVADIEEEIKTAEDFDAWIDALFKRPPNYTPPKITLSSALIRQDYTSGMLSEEEYYILSITAAYDYDQLPGEYRDGAEPDQAVDASWLLREIRQKIDTFSPETHAALQPYLLSCDDPVSFWYDPDQSTASKHLLLLDSYDLLAEMERPAAGGEYFTVTGPSGTEEQQAIVENAMQTAYSAYAGLGFAEPTDWIRVTMKENFSNPSHNGLEWMAELLGQERCHIAIKIDQDKEHLEAVTAHELFHCFQEYMPDADNGTTGPWEWESTAVWAQEFVYPTTNTEHDYDDLRFSSFNDPFFDINGDREYASYLYWFYLHQKDGKTGRTVKNFLEQIYRDGRLAAFADRPDFYSEFKEYALWNFNTPPFTYYEDADGAPSLRPHGLCVKHEKLPAGEQYFEFVFIPQGGVMYYVYKFDRDVEKIRFDLTQLQKTAENQNGIQIVYSADGQDYVEDVSYRDELIFCRNRPAENINEIVFIISNANLDESDRNADLDVEMPIDTRGICIPEWSGFVNCSCASSGPGDGFGTNLYGGSYSSNASSRIDATLLYDPNENQFYAETQEIQHTSSYYWYVEYPVTEVQVTFGYTAWEDKTRQGSGSRSIEYDLGDTCPPECPSDALMIKQYEDDNETLYIHRSQTYRDLGTFKETHQVMNIAGEICEGNDWCVDELWVDEDVHSLSATIPPDPMLLHMNDDGSHMYGTLTDGACSCTAEFSYE